MAARLGFARSRQVGARRRRKIGSDRVGGAESFPSLCEAHGHGLARVRKHPFFFGERKHFFHASTLAVKA